MISTSVPLRIPFYIMNCYFETFIQTQNIRYDTSVYVAAYIFVDSRVHVLKHILPDTFQKCDSSLQIILRLKCQ
jgi:hypothetical protein